MLLTDLAVWNDDWTEQVSLVKDKLTFFSAWIILRESIIPLPLAEETEKLPPRYVFQPFCRYKAQEQIAVESTSTQSEELPTIKKTARKLNGFKLWLAGIVYILLLW